MCADKPNSGDKLQKAKQNKAKHAAYAETVAKSRLDAIAKELKTGKGRSGQKAGPADGRISNKDRDTVYRPGAVPENPQSRVPADRTQAGGENPKSHADGGKLYRPGISDRPQSRPGEQSPEIPPAERYKGMKPGERRFFMLLDKIAEESRQWYAKYGAKRGSEYTRLRGKSEGLDGLSAKGRADVETGNHPQEVAFPLEGRIYFNNPAGGDPQWIDRKDIPYGTTHVANGRLDSLSVQGAPGETDYFIRRTSGSIEVQACYPEDTETISALVTRNQGKGLADSMGNTPQADPDTVRSIQKANQKLNGWMRESLMRGDTIGEAKDFAWKKATDEFLMASAKVISTVLSISANGISMSFGAGMGMGMSGGSSRRPRFGRLKTPGRMRSPRIAEPAAVREPAVPRRTASGQRPAAGSAAGGERISNSPSGKARTVYTEGGLGEIRGEPEVSYTRQGSRKTFGKPEASASPGGEGRPAGRAQTADQGAGRRAEIAGEFAEAQESLPGAVRTEKGNYRSANTRRTLNEQEEPSPGMIRKAQVKTSYDIGLEGAKGAARDGVQVQKWESSTKLQGDYGKNIDDIGVWGENTVILEWKGEGSSLGKGQLGDAWAGRKIAQLEVLKEPMAQTLLEAARSGKLKGMAYRTRAGSDGGLITTRLDKAELRGTKSTRLKSENISDDGVISYSPRKIEQAYRAERARLEQAIKDKDLKALDVLLH